MRAKPTRTFTTLFAAALLLLMHSVSLAQEQNETGNQAETAIPLEATSVAQHPETAAEKMEIVVVVLTEPELAEAANIWQQHLRTHLEAAMRVNVEIEEEGFENTGLRDELASLTLRTEEIVDVYSVILADWKRKGASEENIKPHLNYVSAVRQGLFQTTDVATIIGLGIAWILSWEGGFGLVLQVVTLVLAMCAMVFVARFFTRVVNRVLNKIDTVSHLLVAFILKAVYWMTFIFGILVVLAIFGVNVTPAFALFGGVSFILGFALQETLGNLASGLMLMVYKPFDLGDYVKVGDEKGFVDKMNVVATKIRTLDNRVVTVPNSKIWGEVITNHTDSNIRRVDLVFGIGYDDDADLAEKVLHEIIVDHPKCLDNPAAQVFVGELGDSSVNIFCRPWVKSDDYLKVSWDLTGEAKKRFDEAGITIPFPQRDVHLFHENRKEEKVEKRTQHYLPTGQPTIWKAFSAWAPTKAGKCACSADWGAQHHQQTRRLLRNFTSERPQSA